MDSLSETTDPWWEKPENKDVFYHRDSGIHTHQKCNTYTHGEMFLNIISL